ncbi:MsnO8 family LLM class oxidoreductase [Nocardia sp. NPDC055053]
MPDFPGLSVLETTPINHGDNLAVALQASVEVARLAERLGFARIWVTEYHASHDSGCATPAVFIARLASATDTITIGAGGVMLLNHPPLIVAEEFRMLAGLFAGRVDLGIGRGVGTEEVAIPALRRSGTDDAAYLEQIDELSCFLHGDFPSGHRFAQVSMPQTDAFPAIFILSASEESALHAARLGRPLAFAHYQNAQRSAAAIAAYRSAFTPSAWCAAPYVIASVKVVGRDTDAAARDAATMTTLLRLRKAAVSRGGLDVDDAVLLDPAMSELEQQLVQRQLELGAAVVGGPEGIRDGISRLAAALDVDEIMIVPTEYDGRGRLATLYAVAAARHLCEPTNIGAEIDANY